MGKFFSNIFKNAKKTINILGLFVNKSNDYVENLNLFTVSMGEYASEAQAYAEQVQSILGIDSSEWMRNQGVFMTLATGFGVASDSAATMSKSLTELGYDLSSFFNIGVEDAMQKLQSGISGELEPLRRLGYDLSQAKLQEIAYANGIDRTVSSMTQAEKAQLRYVAIMTQVQSSHGDLARTLETPTNQLRIFREAVTQAARAIGNIFIPMLNIVLPYVIAFVNVIRDAAQFLANLFGFSLPEIDYSGISGVAGAASEAEDALGGATGAAKDLKNAMLGIDELNVISPQTSSGGGGGASVGAGDLGLDLESYGYDFLGEAVAERVSNITGILKPLLALVGLIGAGFLAWKIKDKVTDGLKKILEALSKIAATISPIKIGLAAAVALFAVATVSSENFRNGLAFLGEKAKEVFNFITTGLSEITNAFNMSLNGEQFTAGIAASFVGLGIALAPISPVLGTIVGAAGAVTLALQGLGFATSDAIDEVDLLAGVSEETAEKLEPFLQNTQALSTTLAGIEFSGEIITDEDVDNVRGQLATIVGEITTELDADKNDALANLEPLRAALGEKQYNELIKANEKYYNDATQKVKDGEAEILEIMNAAKENGVEITSEQWDRINEIQQEMQNVGLNAISDSAVEYETIMRNLKNSTDRLSLEQASEIIKNAAKTRDETIDAAEEQYSRQILEAERMYEVGAIDKETYDAIVAAAEQTRKDTVEKAEAQYDGIYKAAEAKLGDLARLIDENTGEIKTKWQAFKDDTLLTFSNLWAGVTQGLEDFKTSFGEALSEAFNNFGETVDGAMNGILKAVERGLNWCIEAINGFSWEVPDWVPKIGGKRFGVNIEPISLGTVDFFASGGYPTRGQLFIANEAGPELVGNVGGRPAVASNQNILDAMTRAIYSAMVTANSDNSSGNQNISIAVYMNEEPITDAVKRVETRAGTSIFDGGVLR